MPSLHPLTLASLDPRYQELAHRTEQLGELNNLWEKGRITFAQDAIQERSESKVVPS